MEAFAAVLNATLQTEMELHRKTCDAFGIPADNLARTRKGMITSAYTDFLLRTSYEGGLPEILAALSPCACGYAEIGQSLGAGKLPDDPFYRDWIRTYSSREFLDLAGWLVGKLNEHAIGASSKRREEWYRLYETSARFEYLFFDMSWKKEEWPGEILAPPGASGDGR
jgi:thiaminase/transcriptional activator TenA